MLITTSRGATEIYYSPGRSTGELSLRAPKDTRAVPFSFHSLFSKNAFSVSERGGNPYLPGCLRFSLSFLLPSSLPSPRTAHLRVLPLARSNPRSRTRRAGVLALHYTRGGIYATAVAPVIPRNHKVRYLDRLSATPPPPSASPRPLASRLCPSGLSLPPSHPSRSPVRASFWSS